MYRYHYHLIEHALPSNMHFLSPVCTANRYVYDHCIGVGKRGYAYVYAHGMGALIMHMLVLIHVSEVKINASSM